MRVPCLSVSSLSSRACTRNIIGPESEGYRRRHNMKPAWLPPSPRYRQQSHLQLRTLRKFTQLECSNAPRRLGTVGTSPTSSPVVRITNQRLPRGPFGWPFAVPFAEPDPLLLAPAPGALLQIEHRNLKPGLGSPRAATSDPGLCRS